jgi:hypothetical protein
MAEQTRQPSESGFRHYAVYVAIFAASVLALTAGFFVERDHLLTGVLELVIPTPETAATLNSLIGHFFNEAGIAGLIACGLAVTIDQLSSRELIRLAEDQRAAVVDQARQLAAEERDAIKHDVFYYTFGTHLPDEIKNEITTQILTEHFIRKEMWMQYVLKPVVDCATRSNYVLVDFELSYEIVNLTTENQEFNLQSAFRKSPVDSLAEQARFITVEVAGAETPFTMIGDEIPTKESEECISLDIKSPVIIKPGPNNPTKVKIHSQSIKHCAGGLSYFMVDYHTCKLELSVFVPANGLKVCSGVSTGRDLLTERFGHKPTEGVYSWELKRPLLAFQGIYVRWDPKKVPEEVTSAAALQAQPIPQETIAASLM